MNKKELIKEITYIPFRVVYFIVYILVYLFLILLPIIFFFGAFGFIFSYGLGLTYWQTAIILVLSLVGSAVNIPVTEMVQYEPVVTERYVSYMGIVWAIPSLSYKREKTIIAVNLGGCLIPVIVSLYLLFDLAITGLFFDIAKILLAILINSLLIHAVARPIKGVGIATPGLIPPLFTVILTVLLGPIGTYTNPFIMAYVTGTFGTLIGADIMNLKKIPEIGAPVASIGGAGTFDGVFLTGIFSVLLLLML